MDRRLRLNLLLLLLVALLGLAVWFSRPADPTPLTSIDPAEVTRIEISDLSGRHIQMRRRDGEWYLDGGKRADQARVAQLLGICRTSSLARFPAPVSLKPYGLKAAPIMLRLNDKSLAFGATDPIHGWRYVLIGKQIHLIADGFYYHLSAPPEAWQAPH
jgi:hypothetical protein